MLPTADQIDALLPMIPGVVRGPDGLINMKGGRASAGMIWWTAEMSPTPRPGIMRCGCPSTWLIGQGDIRSLRSGVRHLTGAVSSLQTTDGNLDHWHASIQNLFVRPRKRDGDFIGLESATPRGTVTGRYSGTRLQSRNHFNIAPYGLRYPAFLSSSAIRSWRVSTPIRR